MTRINPGWLNTAPTQKIVKALASANPLFVGGCVRDALMGRDAHDIDIAVAVEPLQVMALLEQAGLRALPIGIDHGVVAALVGNETIEIATLRRDVETDGRRAVVAFTDDIAEDAMRRDFTVNALYARPDGEVLDPNGQGLADLAAAQLRFIGDADTRISEDYLRILRFYRFSAQFSRTEFDPKGQAACHALVDGLAQISKERIGAELIKLLSAPNPDAALAAMGPVLSQILPTARLKPGLPQIEISLDISPDPLRRLATLDVSPTTAAKALRLSRAELDILTTIEKARVLPLAEAAFRHGTEVTISATAINALHGTTPPKSWRETILYASQATMPITGADLIAQGLPAGPTIGRALKQAEGAWVASGFTLDRQQAIAAAFTEN
jgi:poly(A) polymerase